MKQFIFGLWATFAFTSIGHANNLQISNVQHSGSNLSFTVSWDNSWNTTNNINPLYPNNWDGVWLFAKYQNQIDNLWKHVKVSHVSVDHSVSGANAPLTIEAYADSMGIIIRRTNPGSGNITNAIITLKMGSLVGSGDFNFKVFGIEMVKVTQDTLQAGDGLVSGATYFNPITIDASRQNNGLSAGILYSGCPAIPASFPMGYHAFYSMKYEASNEQWVDFLNTLNYDQQTTRTAILPNAPAGTRAYGSTVVQQSTIEVMIPGLNNTQPAVFGCDFTQDNVYNTDNDGQNHPFLAGSKGDYLAYLDWSGLRPMTELEYEKACRGPRPRVSTEYAWGSTHFAARTWINTINRGTATEASNAPIVNGQVIANSGNGLHGPVRGGIFATNSSGRESSGASFYGIMEMSGNLWELMITAGTGGITFTGIHGNGMLNTLGECDEKSWPDPNGAINTGIFTRGGSWFETTSHSVFTRIAYRHGGVAAARSYVYGIRGVRTAN